MALVIKVRLKPTEKQAEQFTSISEEYRQACNLVSQWYFDHHFKANPQYTSQRCPKYGRINKENRDHDLHLYTCDNCGYKSNDDRLAGMNIFELDKRYLAGDDKPKFVKHRKKNNNTSTHLGY